MTFSGDRPRPVRVLISDLSPLISSGIEAALAASASFETERCGLARVLEGALDGAPPFDVVVVDNELGLRLAGERGRARLPASIGGARIFVFNQSHGERDIRQALESGIHGFATLNLTLEEFREGIRSVARGLRYVCPKSAQRLADSMTREPLTPRETDVLGQLARGCCNKTIASELEMALGTVKAHVKALMSKLGAKTRTEVVTVAIARGLVEPQPGAERAGARSRRGFGPRATGVGELSFAA